MKTTRGYALVLVMTISLILAIGIGTLLSYLAAAEKNSARNRLNREAYYVCDGVGRIVSRTTVDVLSDSRFSVSGPATSLEHILKEEVELRLGTDLETLLDQLRQEYITDEFVYKDVEARTTFGRVALGRYRGLNGQRRTFTYDLALRREGGSTCRTSATIDTVRVPFSEIALFSTESLQVCPEPWATADVSRRGRYHVNGDLVVGRYALPRTTVTGTMNAGCGATNLSVCGDFGPCVGAVGGAAISAAAHVGAGAAAIVAELLADGQRGTSELKFQTSSVEVPRGAWIDDATVDEAALSNTDSMRYLIEPPRQGESAGDVDGRLAHKAHIRILDGAWYVNDGSDWPGRLIWSDHPQNFAVTQAISAEEFDILASDARREIGQHHVPGMPATVPTRYSYFGPAGGTFAEGSRPVVSYGRLKNTAQNSWNPAPDTGGSSDAEKARLAANIGVVDLHRRQHLSSGGRLTPINIDLKALVEAANLTTNGELGQRLTEESIDRTRLIVWVGSTWSGSRDVPRPAALPVGDDGEVPYPLCRDTGTPTDAEHCNVATSHRINAVRVFNGDILPESVRITVATHLPLYVLGDIDRGASDGSLLPLPASPTVPGVSLTGPIFGNNPPSLFFAADTITLLSSSWSDPASATAGLPTRPSVTTPTVYNASFLTGRYMSREPSQRFPFGAERVFRFLERMDNVAHTPIVTGSIMIGYKSVYDESPTCYAQATDPDCRTSQQWRHFWSEHLASESAAPPGMPTFALRGVGETVPDSFQFDFTRLLDFLSFAL